MARAVAFPRALDAGEQLVGLRRDVGLGGCVVSAGGWGADVAGGAAGTAGTAVAFAEMRQEAGAPAT